MISSEVFLIARIILFFIATPYIFKALQSIDLSRIFRPNASDQIRFLFMVIAIILGFLFIDALVSLFENLNQLF
jgi:uncharacterized membrane protein YwzB